MHVLPCRVQTAERGGKKWEGITRNGSWLYEFKKWQRCLISTLGLQAIVSGWESAFLTGAGEIPR